MKRRSPPLNTLRVFKSAARHESFKKASDELNITQTAVSKQIAKLEEHLGLPLFIRHHRSLALTKEGRLIAKGVSLGIEYIEKTLSLLDQPKPERITILTDVDFARLWLFPILPRFEAQFPDIQITLATKNYTQPIDENEEFDLAISWGRGAWNDIFFEPFLTNDVFPICAPDFFNTLPPSLSDVGAFDLIHDRNTQWWRVFFDRAGLHDKDVEGGRIFTQTSLCLEAAMRKDGIAIGDEVSACHYLRNGQLVLPFTERIPSPDAYYLLSKLQTGLSHDPVHLFREWLLKEAGKHRLWYSRFWGSKARKVT